MYTLLNGKKCKREVEVYSLKTGPWRLLAGIFPAVDFLLSSYFGACSYGMCSWLVWSAEYGKHIISYDNEVFMLTLLPLFLCDHRCGYHIELILLNLISH